ncbi:DedD protein [Marinospirillum celere]|uniref:DedD protein n=1 Tax=Marinospirillum celere TaxID=1122252 RepID=A0A1I1J8M7_9GAMM|nr:SPOR domain-containing protein [Marinospirillum celere]SFC44735.1 DedD protein [Marinospirillum celere]
MRYGLKERLIGALALIALAVIFLPLILEEERPPLPVSDKIVMPESPEPLAVDLEASKPPKLQPSVSEEEQQRVESRRERGDQRMQLALEGGVEAWAIQVASLGDSSNARRLVARMEDKGLQTYWRRINNLAVVFVGPFIDQQEARSVQDRLLQEEGLRTLLTRYVPERVAREQGSLPGTNE